MNDKVIPSTAQYLQCVRYRMMIFLEDVLSRNNPYEKSKLKCNEYQMPIATRLNSRALFKVPVPTQVSMVLYST